MDRTSISLLAEPPPNVFGIGRMSSSLLKTSLAKKVGANNPWPSSTPVPMSPAIDTNSNQNLEDALAVESLVRQITEWDSHYADFDSSDAESDILQSAEHEAKKLPLTHDQVKLFDRSMTMRHRRYIERNIDIDSDDDLPSDEEDLNDEDFIELYRSHIKRKKMRKKIRANPELYGEGNKSFGAAAANTNQQQTLPTSCKSFTISDNDQAFLSNANYQLILNGEKLPDPAKARTPKMKKKKVSKPEFEDLSKDSLFIDDQSFSKVITTSQSKKKREKGEKPLTTDQLNMRRKRLWMAIIRKEIGKAHKSRNFNIREKMTNGKRVATQCMRAVRQKAMHSQRVAKETVWRAKRLTREMQAYWKRFDRVERQQKRQQEKEAEEQQKMDLQLLEAKRQQRKLNFLITQTELYAHFIANKIGAKGFGENEADILSKLDETPVNGRLAEIDDYDSENAKMLARNNATQAMEIHQRMTKRYDIEVGAEVPTPVERVEEKKDHSQPNMFHGKLKNYQLKGMNWLLNLYDQGINGILADEMGLGKTVQSLAMLAHIAEKYNIWGPFLVITPASTLHNWQQEVAKFLPSFKVVPYWGSPQERKILRHFWDQTNLHTRSASFHIVITSYQLVVTDFKYFNRIKWQYLVLDEAQAIKSSSSQRWKMLLEFKCRNRLLLSGTPIQNSMAELWSLLHFVMPTLFDSHEEFNDWFSKDIESSAENKSQIDEKQISRLHMILKPFMLRRIKKDVENELTDKLEVLVYCPLTTRQKLLYMGLKRKIRIEDLLQGLGSQSQNSAIASSLMNLVMQFRKVCNHPELFERREARSPFVMDIGHHVIPKLVFHQRIHSSLRSKNHILFNKFCIYNPENVHHSLNPPKSNEYLEVSSSPFSFLRFVDTSTSELNEITFSLLKRWCHLARQVKKCHDRLYYDNCFRQSDETKFIGNRGLLIYRPRVSIVETPKLVFTRVGSGCIFSHSDVTIRSMPETVEHRLIRTKHRSHHRHPEHHHKNLFQNIVPEFPYVPRPDIIRHSEPCLLPKFLLGTCLRVTTPGRLPYSYDRSAAWSLQDHLFCTNKEGMLAVKFGIPELAEECAKSRTSLTSTFNAGGILGTKPPLGWSNIIVPDKETLVFDAGKLFVLDGLLARLKCEGHRVLIYSQMTRMIDLLEEYMTHRKHTFMRLDGSSKIHERRDMVADFQERTDIFVFLLSTRAGGLGINLTAADTVIFYDSDWNPTVDQQAMDRAHRLGQTKQVTVYRLICKGTIEERILQRAKEKSAIQQMVIQGGSFKGKGGDLKPKEVVSLLLDDEEIEKKYKEQQLQIQDKDKKRKRPPTETPSPCSEIASSKFSENFQVQLSKKLKLVKEEDSSAAVSCFEDESTSMLLNIDEESTDKIQSDDDDNFANVDIEGCSDNAMSREPTRPTSPLFDFLGEKLGPKRCRARTGGKRGRPRGALKSGQHRENSSPSETSQSLTQTGSSPFSKRGPGRPRVKAGGSGGPLHQGTRGPPNQPKLNRGILQA